ncbi:dimethylaniline monooxygenase [N-oxide-forming] 2-like isoform X1 [Rana temporaria]|uniref:dimethylaniline monooxygenase [N-oxide-forming] 2-like isoform X1 n=1 Tax=Rana temporaria TaxID=8407 RepID=UPI001AAE10F7|nr:dimethylaniline monooxygenase [N-oxide-forming] 2-like isoform X1 [Rana temporaria]
MVRKVAVIGSGVSGLAAIKACLEEGLEPTCFEKSCDIGGLWRFTDEVEDKRASIYSSLVTNVSKETMCFSDFPMPADFPNFLPNRKYFEYIKLYAENFHLTKYIQFKTKVCRVEKHPDFPVNGQWNITTESDGEKKTAIFDAVLVCTGQHVDAQIPLDNFPGIQNFKGKVLHSRDYKRPVGFDGKRVLIVGMGNTGVDISTELCTLASQVYLTTREGVWVIPRLGKHGYPYDVFLLRRINSWIENLVPRSVSRWMLKLYLNNRFNHELYNIQPEGIIWKEPLVNDEIASRVLSGSIIIKPGVVKFTETDAHFSDGSIVHDLDVVILCTGFGYSFPFLDESVSKKDENKGNLYKKIIPVGIEKPTIAFIAFLLPIGPTMVAAELQSRWATRVFKGLHKLPDVNGMKEDMLKDEKLRKKWFATSKNNFRRTDYMTYIEDIASDIGVKPDILKLFLTDPVLAVKLVFGALNSYHFRLSGPAKWDGAREAILTQWDRIEKPLRTRVPKRNSKSPLTSFMLLFFCFVTLFAAVWLKH